MTALALRINDFLTGLFLGIGIKLVDFKVEFGRIFENDMMRIVLADEISPDSCRLWDIDTDEKLDKDRFRSRHGRPDRGLSGRRPQAWHSVRERTAPNASGPVLVKS